MGGGANGLEKEVGLVGELLVFKGFIFSPSLSRFRHLIGSWSLRREELPYWVSCDWRR